jgi:ATP-dependent Clp protease ATP-binding subunit ClpC
MGYEDRFTERAKQALTAAQEAASELGHGYVGSEHILLGLTRQEDGVAAKVLREAGIDSNLVLELIEKYVGRGESGDPAQGLTPRSKRIIEIAAAEANRLGHSYVGTEHLLMGILREHESVASKLIASTGVDLNKLYTDIINVFRSSDYKQQEPVSSGKGVKHANTKTLDQFSRDLTDAARAGKLDPVIGRDQEIQRPAPESSRT